MKDKFEFDETEIRRIPDETTIMELKGKHYGVTVNQMQCRAQLTS